MVFGYCTGFSTAPHFQLGVELLEMIRDKGFDFVEFPLMNFHDMTEAQFGELERKVKDMGLTGPTACNFFPGSVRLVGKEVDAEKIEKYLNVVLDRCNRLGISTIILGSGPARTFGPEQTRDQAFAQFASLLKDVVLPKTKAYGMTVCIEPFERTYCNLIVSVLEGLELVKAVDDEGLLLMVDLYHMLSNGEPLSSLRECFPYIRHVHVAGPDRRVPNSEDSYIFEALRLLGDLGYKGSVSFETELPEPGTELSEVLCKVKSSIGAIKE